MWAGLTSDSDTLSKPASFAPAEPGLPTDARIPVLLIGLTVMFGPTFFDLLVGGEWTDAQNSHGPLVFAISIWLFWRRRGTGLDRVDDEPAPIGAWFCLLIAAVLYVPGRALQLAYVEVGAFIWAFAGTVLLIGGTRLLKRVAFPIVFMLFMIPLPNFVVGEASGLLKQAVSAAAVDVLAGLDYPVARSGVIMSIGQYQLLVADACAGMSNLFMLETLGVLYLNLVRHRSILRNVALPILIVPISFISNVGRVVVLALITYYLGDEAGQGFLHGFAGIVLFLLGLSLMILTDSILRLVGRHRDV
jgi:exosortase B